MATTILKVVSAEIYPKGLLADIPGDFNHSSLFCLPKKMDYIHPLYGEVYKCESTRPLSVVDTSNRFLALAFKICLNDYLESLDLQGATGISEWPLHVQEHLGDGLP